MRISSTLAVLMSVLDNEFSRRPQRAIEHANTHAQTHTHTSPSVRVRIKKQDGGLKDAEITWKFAFSDFSALHFQRRLIWENNDDNRLNKQQKHISHEASCPVPVLLLRFPFHYMYTSKSSCICSTTLTSWWPLGMPLSPVEDYCALEHSLPAVLNNSPHHWGTGLKSCEFDNCECVQADFCICVYASITLYY